MGRDAARKDNVKILLAAALASLALLACTTDSGDSAPNVRVWITDTAGVSHPADTVYYSYAPDVLHTAKVAHGGEGDSVMHGATCANADCSEWAITDPVHGALYIRASYSDPTSPFCGEYAYTVKHVTADDLPMEVTVVLDVDEVCL
jgi:hypothetical protein